MQLEDKIAAVYRDTETVLTFAALLPLVRDSRNLRVPCLFVGSCHFPRILGAYHFY